MSNILKKLLKKKVIPGFAMYLSPDKQLKRVKETLHKHFGDSVVVSTPAISDDKVCTVSEEKLRKGEISAVMYSRGCYAIRDAYVVYKDSNECMYTERIPADKEIVDIYKKYLDENRDLMFMEFDDKMAVNGTRLVREIHVAYKYDSSPKWKFVCLATNGYSWVESINFIGVIKESIFVSDKESDLLILVDWMGDSRSTETWYKVSPDGIIKSYSVHPYDSDSDEKQWEW